MPDTTSLGIPYPLGSEAPFGATQIGSLAEAINSLIVADRGRITLLEPALNTRVYQSTNDSSIDVTSTSFVVGASDMDLSVTMGSTGLALVQVAGVGSNNTVGQRAIMSFTTTAGDVASSDSRAFSNTASTAGYFNQSSSGLCLVTATPGVTRIFRPHYRVTGGTGSFSRRRLLVIVL